MPSTASACSCPRSNGFALSINSLSMACIIANLSESLMSMSFALLRTKSIYGGRSISGMPGDVGNDFEVGLNRASHGGEHPTR